jgi:hypothetical protein
MKKIIILSAALLIATLNNAQQVTAGQKINLVTRQDMVMTMNVAGNSMEIPMKSETEANVQIKSVNGSSIQGTFAATHMKFSTTAMGQETTFDTNDSSFKSTPQANELMEKMKPQDFVIENGKYKNLSSVKKNDFMSSFTDMFGGWPSYIFLPKNAVNAKENYSWVEDINDTTSGMKSKNVYTVTKVTESTIELSVLYDIKINTIIQQQGMDMKMNLGMSGNDTRVYNKTTSILKSGSAPLVMSGTSEVMGQEVPMTFKGSYQTIVQ